MASARVVLVALLSFASVGIWSLSFGFLIPFVGLRTGDEFPAVVPTEVEVGIDDPSVIGESPFIDEGVPLKIVWGAMTGEDD